MQRCFFQAAVVSILLYGCTTWTLTKRMEKKIDSNYKRMLQAILNKSSKSSSCTATYHPSRKLFKWDEPGMQDTAGEVGTNSCDILLWTPSHGRVKAGQPAKTYIQQLWADTECNLEDLPEAKDNREGGEGGSGRFTLVTRHEEYILSTAMSLSFP